MSAKYFSPICSIPSYLLETKKQAENCGLINGITLAFIVSFPVTFLIGKLYVSSQSDIGKKRVLIIGGIIMILLWLIIPLSLRSGSGKMWTGQTTLVSNLLNLGYTRIQAINILQNTSSSTDSTLGTIGMVGGAGLLTSTVTPKI
jgi:hypothetical protein